jgi:deoxyxylulose-5-phosphate synthase
MSILKTIQSPADLKRLSPAQFPPLCQELREQIIDAVSNVGGHLASNLGVVELTVALHYLLDTPQDKIVWDTSNQAYTHKLLTGPYPAAVRRVERVLQTRRECVRYLQCGPCGNRRLRRLRHGRSP